MRGFFVRLIKNERFLKGLYRALFVFLSICWGIMAVFAIKLYVEKKFLYPLEFSEHVFLYADKYGLDRATVFSIIKTESNFNVNAVSSAGAIGLMQITPSTAEYIAERLNMNEYDLRDAENNIQFGCYYMNYLIFRFKNVQTAHVAYNAGEGNVQKWLSNKEYSADGVTLKVIPFEETKEYIKKIQKNFAKYKKLYKNILDKRQNFE